MSEPRVLFYVQHLLGIGHLARASRLARALVDDGLDVTVVTGGTSVAGFPGASIRTVALPAVTSPDQGFSGLADENGNAVDDAFGNRRRDLLLETFRSLRPDIVILEAFPFGRRQMRFELLPLLDAIAASQPRPLLVTSLRDIVQERVKPGRDEETVDLVNRHFDLVMVHGDPGFARLEDSFGLTDLIAGKLAYTGLVAAAAPEPSREVFDVLISAGGGAAGADLVRSSVEAAKAFPQARWCLITGPNLPAAAFETARAAAPESLQLFRFRQDFASLLASAKLSVSQAGYNTVCDILNAGCRSLLVPFTAGGETEQAVRAQRLERLGLASIIEENALTPATLATAIDRALSSAAPPRHQINLDGARQSARLLRDLLKRSRSA